MFNRVVFRKKMGSNLKYLNIHHHNRKNFKMLDCGWIVFLGLVRSLRFNPCLCTLGKGTEKASAKDHGERMKARIDCTELNKTINCTRHFLMLDLYLFILSGYPEHQDLIR